MEHEYGSSHPPTAKSGNVPTKQPAPFRPTAGNHPVQDVIAHDMGLSSGRMDYEKDDQSGGSSMPTAKR